jgi:hypothetical protein
VGQVEKSGNQSPTRQVGQGEVSNLDRWDRERSGDQSPTRQVGQGEVSNSGSF